MWGRWLVQIPHEPPSPFFFSPEKGRNCIEPKKIGREGKGVRGKGR